MSPRNSTPGAVAGNSRPDEVVEIRMPASTGYLAVARLAVTGLISDADPDVEVVERLQLALNEVLVLLVEASAEGAAIEVELRRLGDGVSVHACTTQPLEDWPQDPDPLTVRVLDATTRSWHLDPDGSAHLVVPVGSG
jgi:hypothetical protein